MEDEITGAFISRKDPDLIQGNTCCEIRLDLIRAYMADHPDADTLRLSTGTYSKAATYIAVLVQRGNVLYYNGTGGEDLLEHIQPVQ